MLIGAEANATKMAAMNTNPNSNLKASGSRPTRISAMVATFIAVIRCAFTGARAYQNKLSVYPLNGIKKMQIYRIVARTTAPGKTRDGGRTSRARPRARPDKRASTRDALAAGVTGSLRRARRD